MESQVAIFYPTTSRFVKIAFFGLFSTSILGLTPLIPDNPFSFFPVLFVPFTVYMSVFSLLVLAKKKTLLINEQGLFDAVSMIMPSKIYWSDIQQISAMPQRNKIFIELQLKSLHEVIERESFARRWFLKAALFDYTGKMNRAYIDPSMFGTTAEALIQQIKMHASVSVASPAVLY